MDDEQENEYESTCCVITCPDCDQPSCECTCYDCEDDDYESELA